VVVKKRKTGKTRKQENKIENKIISFLVSKKGSQERKLGFPGGERFGVLSHSATLTPGNPGKARACLLSRGILSNRNTR
jgi:hypothetical protein